MAGPSLANPRWLTEADILSVLDRVFPEWYLEPLKDPGPGYELLQAWAAALERVSLGIGRFECQSLILFSTGAGFSVASVEFYRSSASAGAFTVKRGTITRATSSSRSYVLLDDVVFGAMDLFRPGQVRAVAPGYEYDVPGPVSTADGTVLDGDIDYVAIPLLDPVLAEPTIQVRQVSAAVGGQPPALDQHGLDRDLPRLPNEPDESYRKRIRELPDTITPDSLHRQLDAIFIPLGLGYDLIETWENRYNSCWNDPSNGVTNPVFGSLVALAYNDPRVDRFIPRWMAERDRRAGFAVVVPTTAAIRDHGMAYNDPSLTAVTTRGTPAYSVGVLSGGGFPGVYDGEDVDARSSRAALLRRVWDLLRMVKGAGTAVAFFPVEDGETLGP